MTKNEIEHRIKTHKNAIMASESVIVILKDQLAEAEKLEELDKLLEKPKHGDFGMNMLFPRIVINGAVYNASGECIRNVDDGAIGKHCTEIWLGNVFDLMKGWSEPFKEYDADKYATGIRIGEAKIRIYACTGQDCKKEDCSCGLFLDEAKEFHKALGHAIAELKQKENK